MEKVFKNVIEGRVFGIKVLALKINQITSEK
jgi:hypothetical protein